MSATMNKTVPWNVKGVGFDAREIAHRAARHEGVPVGQWLNGVIRARADELGVSVDDFTQEERLDALVARLAGVAESVKAEEKSSDVRTSHSTHPHGSSGTAGAQAMTSSWTDDDEFRVRNSRSSRALTAAERERDDDLSGRYQPEPEPERVSRRWEDEILLDQAMELVERRTTAAQERAQGERQRMRIAALAREVDRLNRAEADSTAERFRTRHRRTEQPDEPVRQPFSGSQAAPPDRRSVGHEHNTALRSSRTSGRSDGDMASSSPGEAGFVAGPTRKGVTEDLDAQFRRLSAHFADRSSADAQRRMRDRSSDERTVAAQAGRGSGPLSEPVDVSHPASHRARAGRRDAIAEITGRQADLDAGESRRSELLNSASRPSMDSVRRSRPAQPAPPPPKPDHATASADLFGQGDPFDNLNEAFARLTERLESRLDEATKLRAQAARQPDAEIGALKSGIAALGTRLDAMKEQVELSHATTAERAGVEALRNEIAALQVGLAKLAPQSSIATLETAVRELGGQIDDSRRDGVSDAVLQPIERLRTEVQKAVEAREVRGALDRVEHQLGALSQRVETVGANEPALARLDEIRHGAAEIRNLLEGAADQFEVITRLEGQLGQLGARVERLTDTSPRAALRDLELATNEIRTMLVELSPETALQDLSRKLDGLAERFGFIEEHIAAPTAMFDEFARRMDDAHAALAERLIRAAPVVDLGPIEDMIGGLSGKIDGLRYPVADMQALGGLIRGLAAQIEDARLPSADAKILDGLESQVGRLAERLDRSDANLDAIASVERLVRDLFSQLDETRSATVDAAESAARTAAQDVIRGAAHAEGTQDDQAGNRATRALEQVSLELSDFRKLHQTSEKRVHSTLMALNATLERMVDAAAVRSEAPQAVREPSAAVVDARADAVVPSAVPAPEVSAAVSTQVVEPIVSEASSVEPKRPAAPMVDIGRAAALAEPMPDVSPLIAAARRAAQAAQTSATEINRKADLWDMSPKPASQPKSAKGWRAVFRQKRRPMLLSIASVVLLLGALEIARLNMTSRTETASETNDAASTGATTAGKSAEVTPAGKSDSKVAFAPAEVAAGNPAAAGAPAGQTASLAAVTPGASTVDRSPATTASVPADAAPKTLATNLRTLADRGDAAAQAEVGARLADGRGVTRDAKGAATWFQRAADQGYAPAEYRLGSAYEKGTGVQADPVQAVNWYEKAATQGNVRAMHNIAVMAAEGSGGKADYARAATWFTKAAEHGVRDSQYNLAILYARGLGLSQDLVQSYTWFSVAAAQGDADAAKKRDDVAAKLDPDKVASAKAAAAAFKPLQVDKSANDITPPAGGWDVASPATGVGAPPKVSSM